MERALFKDCRVKRLKAEVEKRKGFKVAAYSASLILGKSSFQIRFLIAVPYLLFGLSLIVPEWIQVKPEMHSCNHKNW